MSTSDTRSKVCKFLYITFSSFVSFQSASSNAADLLSFCQGAAPTEQVALAAYNAQCAAYLQSQLSGPATVAQNADRTAQIAQEQSQIAMVTSLAALVKAPPTQVTAGTDISGLGVAGLKKDAELTYAIAAKIGARISGSLSSQRNALVVTGSELTALLSSPVDASTVMSALDQYTMSVSNLRCLADATTTVAPVVPALVMGVYGAQALLSSAATVASAFQPTLVSSAKLTGVADPQNLMVAGLTSNMSADKRALLRLNVPAISASNTVLISLGQLRTAIVAANRRLTTPVPCVKDEVALKQAASVLADAKEFLTALTKTDGTKPSLLDVSARRAALSDAKIGLLLLLSRDVSGGGIAAVKKNWFTSTALLLGTAVGVSYRLVDLDGRVELSGYVSDTWADRCSFDRWTNSFTACTTEARN